MNKNLNWLNITPLMVDYCDDLCRDSLTLFEEGVISETAYCMTLVPEGNPVHDKAVEYARRYRLFRKRLGDSPMKTGMLIQATMGHGWIPDSPAFYQRLVLPDGGQPYMFCTEDRQFQDYIVRSIQILVREKPDFLMIDDDFRYLTCRKGCYCPLHLAEFNRRTGQNFTRKTLIEAIGNNVEIACAYDRMLKESLVQFARIIRNAIDEIDPSIPCSFCMCVHDLQHAPEIARELAGKNQPVTVRINNARYLNDSLRAMPFWLYTTARQIQGLPEDFRVLAEPDTFPHSRYSTGTGMLHAHLTFSLLEGAEGGKLWITRMDKFAPGSGVAFRSLLKKYRDYYRKVANLHPVWHGVCIPLPQKTLCYLPVAFSERLPVANWATEVLGKMGIPFFFAKNYRYPVMLSGSDIQSFADEELPDILSGQVFLDGGAALLLGQRNMSRLIGVEAQVWSGESPSLELLAGNIQIKSWDAQSVVKLNHPAKDAQVTSMLFRTPDGDGGEMVDPAPGSVRFVNELGGVVTTMAAMIDTFQLKSFFLLNEDRKKQLIDFLSELQMPVLYYPGDAELLLKAGECQEGGVAAILNTGMDTHMELELAGSWIDYPLCQLAPDGQWRPIPTRRESDRLFVTADLHPLDILILRFDISV